MTNSSSSKKHGQDQSELSGPTSKSQRTKMGKSEDNDKKVTLFQFRFGYPNRKNKGFPKPRPFLECVKLAA